MSSEAIRVFQDACGRIIEHPLLSTIDWYADLAGPSSLRIDFGLHGTGFPQIIVDWKDTPADVISVAEHASALYNQRFLVADTARKLNFGITALAEYVVKDNSSLIAVEYHAESYFVRAGALGEQVIRLIGLAFKFPNAAAERIHRLGLLIKAALPSIAVEFDAFQQAMSIVKSRRNEAAHQSTFSDARLDGLRGLLSPSAAFGFDPWRQHLEVIEKYRTVFLEEAAKEMKRIAQRGCALFEPIASIVDGYSNAELRRQRSTAESQSDS